MKYNLANQAEVTRAREYLDQLITWKKVIELKKIVPKRSLSQNAYLHVTFGIFSIHTGFTLEESKDIYKKRANPDIYVYTKRGIKFLRSSADLTTEEMTKSIDRWREYAAQHDIHIPLPNEEEMLRYWQNEIEMQSKYL